MTPRPRVHGPQTAIVVGDDEIHTDEHGRVQVQFHWEESPSNAAGATCWIRCAQSLSGMGWGAQFIPRVGMEVVVEFLEGNPDRPLVTGCVYNGANPFPFAVPDDKTQTGLRTSSVPGGEGYHELRFEDAAGSEEIYLRSQRDWAIEVLHDKAQTVGNDETREVGRDRTLSVGANQIETIGENYELTVGKSQLVKIGDSSTTNVDGTATTSVGKDCQLQVKGELTTAVKKDSRFEAENVSCKARGKIQQSSDAETVIEVGGRFGLAVKAKLVIEGEAKGRIELADELVIACGSASIKLESSGNITLTGNDIKLKADGDIKLKGSQVGSN